MSAKIRLDDLVSFWQERYACGQDVPAAELCRDCPELLPEVERRLLALREMHQLADTGETKITLVFDAESASHAPTSPRAVTGYEILEEMGRGGMGVVYKARQPALKRLVALKMILAGAHAGPEHLARFRAEAEVVARLKHPNIVEIHEVGQSEGQPYFALEFVGGGSLMQKLTGAPLQPRKAAALAETLARAVHYAHEQGVIHRDLKPANVLLDEQGQPKITDFGLAKQLESDAGRTQTGAILGTPSYMAPEQAAGGKAIGPRTDVYALGATLYEMLTGRPPFKTASVLETLEQVRCAEPAAPSRLQMNLPRDLETVCLKCLHKEPERRYDSALALAEDLRRFLKNEPIQARPVSLVERAVKWAKRRPTLAAVTAALAIAVVALLGLGFHFSTRMGEARGALAAEEARSTAARHLAETHEFFGLLRAAEKRSARPEPGWTWANLADLEKAARMAPAAGHLAALRAEATAALGGVDLRLARTERLKAWGDPLVARCLAYDPRGRYLALGQERATMYLLGHVALVDPEGKVKPRLLSWSLDRDVAKASLRARSQEGVRSLAFSPDGRWLVAGTAYGMLHSWDLSHEPPVHISRTAHGMELVAWLAFSPDGSALYSGGKDGTVKRWSFPELKETARATLGKPVDGLALHPTEGWVCCAAEGKTRCLSADTLQAIRPDMSRSSGHLCFAPDGNSVLYQFGSRLELFDLRSERVIRSLVAPGEEGAHEGWISSLAFSPDGGLIVSAAMGKKLRLWETASGRLLADVPVAGVRPDAAFHPNGRSLAVTAGAQVHFYEIGGLREQTFLAARPYPVTACALHPDGRGLVCLSRSVVDGLGEVSVWPLETAATASPMALYTVPDYSPESPHPLALHPSSRALACGRGGALTLLGLPGGKTMDVPAGRVGIPGLTFGPSGRLLVAAGAEVQVRELPDGRLAASWSSNKVREWTGASDPLCVAAGGRWVAAGGDNGLVYLLSAANAALSASPRISDSPVRSVAMTADESLVAAGTDRGELRLVRVPDGAVVAKASPHSDRVTALACVGNGLLASGSRDRTVRLWRCDSDALRELVTLPMPAPVRWLALHPDGVRLFVLLERERAVRVWHLDRLRERLTTLGLGAELGGIERAGLPPAVVAPAEPTPPTEPPKGPNGLRAELFGDIHWQRCIKVRYDPQIDFAWGKGAPDPLLPQDCFSVRWTGWLKAPRPGRYTLQLAHDDGVRLWLDGNLVIDRWETANAPYAVEIELTGRPQALRIDYFEAFGNARVQLSWAQQNGFTIQPIPPWALFHERGAAERAMGDPVRTGK